jgi:hypothetical protein
LDVDGVDEEVEGRIESGKRTIVMPCEFASFRLHVRKDLDGIDGTRLFCFGRLTSEYIVDVYCTIEHGRLTFARIHQNVLRAHLYQGVQDVMTRDDGDVQRIGRRIILPPSFVGGPRYMLQLYQDAMAIVRYYGKPNYFLIMTSNPKWPEISRELLLGQTSIDRPDLVARVFQKKQMALLDLVLKKQILSKVVEHIHTVEFQKRGLPHMHFCIIVGSDDKPRISEDIDTVISAEIPDPYIHPKLHATVVNCMMHGPCRVLNPNATCMENGKCTKGFPKPFAIETILDEKGHITYRRYLLFI